MSPSARRLSWIAGGAVIAFSVAIFILASTNRSLDPPDLLSRPLASALLLATPGLVGWIGAATARSSVLVASGVACLFQSVIAFSGVTLIYLVPAIMFLQAAHGASGPRDGETVRPIRPIRVVLAAVVSVPIALVVLFNLGLFGVIGLVLAAGVASLRANRSRPTVMPLEAVRGLAIVLLVIGAWAATLALTETTCWVAHGAADGSLVWERIPPSDTLTLELGDVASSCASGTVTPTGVALAGGLLVASLGVAAIPTRRPRPTTA
jgi:hypothetical protein